MDLDQTELQCNINIWICIGFVWVLAMAIGLPVSFCTCNTQEDHEQYSKMYQLDTNTMIICTPLMSSTHTKDH